MTQIPRHIVLRAIHNLHLALAGMHGGEEMQSMVDAEIRLLMEKEYPGVKVTEREISLALYAAAAEAHKQEKEERACPVSQSQGILYKTMNPNGLTKHEFEGLMTEFCGYVKLMTGVANSAAISIALDCHNKIADVRSKESYSERPWSPHPRYRQRAKQLFKTAISDEYRKYRRNLIHPLPTVERFFSVADIPDNARKKYGDITDEQFFEFWEGSGVLAYQKSQPLIGSLWNKFRLSMLNHGVENAPLLAWGLVGASVLELAVFVWESTMLDVFDACGGIISMEDTKKIFAPFSIRRISEAWNRALMELEPLAGTCQLDSVEERNVQLGVEQLRSLWFSPELSFDSTIQAVKDFSDDIFSTKGQAKKAILGLLESKENALKEK